MIEQYLSGPEVSLFVVTDGTAAVPLMPAQDFKRLADGDAGPNTGGMGAYAPLVGAGRSGAAGDARVVEPTLAEMRERGTPFAGLLYVGLALTPDGPKVIEFNARFGDPETQVVLALLETPLGGLLHAAATGTLSDHPPLRWQDGAAVTVVVASQNYPATPRTGDVIEGAERPGVIHAGTARRADGALVSAGGRVLSVTAVGPDLAAARDAAYALLDGVRLDGAHYRTDIARKAVEGRSRHPGRRHQAFGMSKSLATWAANARSPLALILPVMNIIIGLPSPETTLRNVTGSMVMASLGSRVARLATVQAPFSITVS